MNRKIRIFKVLLVASVLCFGTISYAQDVIVLDDNQSMSITGKGPGQDAAINPYIGSDSYAIIKNIAGAPFEARVQQNGKIISIVKILRGKEVKLKLLKGHELYFDSTKKSKVSIKFEKAE